MAGNTAVSIDTAAGRQPAAAAPAQDHGSPGVRTACADGAALFALLIGEVLVGALLLVVASLCLVGIGLPVLRPTLVLVRGCARAAHRIAARWAAPVDTAAIDAPMPTTRELLSSRRTWRQVGWLLVDPFVTASYVLLPLATTLYGVFGVCVQPFVWRRIDRAGGNNWYTAVHVDTGTAALVAVPVGAALVVLGLRSGPAVLRVYARWIRIWAPITG